MTRGDRTMQLPKEPVEYTCSFSGLVWVSTPLKIVLGLLVLVLVLFLLLHRVCRRLSLGPLWQLIYDPPSD